MKRFLFLFILLASTGYSYSQTIPVVEFSLTDNFGQFLLTLKRDGEVKLNSTTLGVINQNGEFIGKDGKLIARVSSKNHVQDKRKKSLGIITAKGFKLEKQSEELIWSQFGQLVMPDETGFSMYPYSPENTKTASFLAIIYLSMHDNKLPVIPASVLNPTVMTIQVFTEHEVKSPLSNSVNDMEIAPDGKVYHMGKATYTPFTKRCTYALKNEDAQKLLHSNLVFLPYFGEQKTTITLHDYFDLLDKKANLEHLFPKDLSYYLNQPIEEQSYFETLFNPNSVITSPIVVIRYNNKIYVDNVYYRLERDLPIISDQGECDNEYLKGTITDFLINSSIVAKKMDEGIPAISANLYPIEPAAYSNDQIVVSITAGSCNGPCPSYSLQVYGDGRFNYVGHSNVEHIGSFSSTTTRKKINLILEYANDLNYSSIYTQLHPNPQMHVNDGVSTSLLLWTKETPQQLTVSSGNQIPKEFTQLLQFIIDTFKEEVDNL